jgi:hypothetical protein
MLMAPLTAAVLMPLAAACSDDNGDGSIAEAADSTEAASESTDAPPTTVHDHDSMADAEADPAELAAANLAAAAFQDVEMAEAAGYGSTIDALGCFENVEEGGMGLHYLNEALMDDQVDITTPEALVYELDADGEIVGLVAHEYIVPVEAWTNEEPPNLFGLDFHEHPVLPLWVLHAWIWKDNPAGVFADWNPTVRLCPSGVPIFGAEPEAIVTQRASTAARVAV